MDSLKSVLFVLPSREIGGAETKLFELLSGLSGIRKILLTHRAVADYYSGLDINIYTFEDHGCHKPLPVSPLKTIRYAKAIAKTSRRESSSCLIGIMHTGSFYVSAARDIFRINSPYIGTIEGNITAYFDSEERSPTVIEKSLLWYLLNRPSLLVVPSEGVRNDLRNSFGIAQEKIRVIYNGIDITKVQEAARKQADITDGYRGKTILTSCRLNSQKDFLTLLKAFKTVKEKVDSRLIIVGDGELKEEIVGHAKNLGIEGDLTLTGFQQNPFTFMKTADVSVLSSFFEGFGNVIVESMALGTPVVATDCPSGPSEIIQHGISGFLVPVRDHKGMADAILRILTVEKTRNTLVQHGLERAEHFRVDRMIEKFTGIIEKVSG